MYACKTRDIDKRRSIKSTKYDDMKCTIASYPSCYHLANDSG